MADTASLAPLAGELSAKDPQQRGAHVTGTAGDRNTELVLPNPL